MKAIGFEGTVDAAGNIAVPPALRPELPQGARLEVVIRWGDEMTDDEAWRQLGRARFDAAYGPEDDGLYDDLADASSIR